MTAPRKNCPARILVVDDDPGPLRLLTIRLRSEKYEVEPVASAAGALDSAVLFRPISYPDLRMAEMDGIGLLKELQKRWPGLSVILLTAHGTILDAVRATQSGACAFLTSRSKGSPACGSAPGAAHVWFHRRQGGVVDRVPDATPDFGSARAGPMVEHGHLRAAHRRVGNRKEQLARAIHMFSPRRDGPFIAMDCGSLAPETVEGRLAGALRAAESGTVFLRNVDALPEALQRGLAQAIRPRQPSIPRAVRPTPASASCDQRASGSTNSSPHSSSRRVCSTG